MLVCCGSGVGSSFMLEMNIKKVLSDLNITSLDVDHVSLSCIEGCRADIYIATRELASKLDNLDGEIISLNNIFDIGEIKDKISEVLRKKEIL